MTKDKKKFLKTLKKSFKIAPELTVIQILFNLDVIQQVKAGENYFFKDNYNESDETTIQKVKEGFKKLFRNAFKVCKETHYEQKATEP